MNVNIEISSNLMGLTRASLICNAPVPDAEAISAFADHAAVFRSPCLVLPAACLRKEKKHRAATASTPIADPTPIPALVPAERAHFEPIELLVDDFVAGELFVDDLGAVADWFEADVDMMVKNTEEIVDVDKETTFSFLGVTPSQMNAKELKATSARISPSTLTLRRSFIRFAKPGLGSSSVGPAVQLLLL